MERGGTITGTGPNKTYHIVDGAVDVRPFVKHQHVSLPQDTSLVITLHAMDPYLLPLTYAVIEPVAHGTLTGDSTNRVYTPVPGYSGTDRFTCKASNGSNDSNEATITIQVLPANQVSDAGHSAMLTTRAAAK